MNLIFLKTKNIIPTFLHKNLCNIRNSFESQYNIKVGIIQILFIKILFIYIKFIELAGEK